MQRTQARQRRVPFCTPRELPAFSVDGPALLCWTFSCNGMAGMRQGLGISAEIHDMRRGLGTRPAALRFPCERADSAAGRARLNDSEPPTLKHPQEIGP